MRDLPDRARAAQPPITPLLGLALAALIGLAVIAPLLEEQLTGGASAWRRFGYLAVALVALVGLRPWAEPKRLIALPWPLVGALAWCWLSVTWSATSAEAVARVLLTSLVAWTGCAAVQGLGYRRSLLLVRAVFAAALAINFVAVIVAPQIAVVVHPFGWSDRQWIGLMAHKNYAGALCAATAILFLFDVERRHRQWAWGIAAAAALFVVLTVSRTAIFAGLAGIAAGAVVATQAHRLAAALIGPRRRAIQLAGYVLLALIGAFLIYVTIDDSLLALLLDNPDALSRRTQVWMPLIEAYRGQPLIGVGFGSFWTGDEATALKGAGVTALAQGHNGYLDLLVQTGVPGFLLALWAILVWPVRQLARQVGLAPQSTALLAALLVFCLGSNMTESGLLNRDTIWWLLMVLVIGWIAAQGQALAASRAPRRERRNAGRGEGGRRRRSSSECGERGEGSGERRRQRSSRSSTEG